MVATVIQITSRGTAGAAGAPSSAMSAQIFYNMADGLFYVGYGDNGSGGATSIKAFAKDDFTPLQRLPGGGTSGQVLTKTSASDYAVAWSAAPLAYTGGTGITLTGSSIAVDTSTIATVSSVTSGLALKAPLASPALTGTPTAPTAAAGTATTQIASTAYVRSEINSLLNGAGAAYDTLKELQDILVTDEGTVASLTTTVGGKLTKASNLSDLTDASAARVNLGLSSMATQAASAIAVTGGTMAGVTLSNCVISGGTF